MKTRLVNYREGAIDLVFAIDRPRITIGRDTDNMIQLPNEKISKHHGVILQTPDGSAIKDLQSRNGVFVNGRRTTRAELKNGDCVKIGPYELYFETNVPYDGFVPSHIIEVSSKVNDQTLSDENTPGRS
jgi:pSer/pThr/pTyr-binding forkhead associated (FHA) protein